MEFTKPEYLRTDGDIAENFKKFKEQFEIYFIATQADKKPREVQVALLKNLLGEDGMKLYVCLTKVPSNEETVSSILQTLEDYCVPKKNYVLNLVKFLRRKQQPREPFEKFINDLKFLVRDCDLEIHEEKLIKVQIALGTFSTRVRKRLLMYDEPLDTIILFCRAVELAANNVSLISKTVPDSFSPQLTDPSGSPHIRCKQCDYVQCSNNPCPAFGKLCSRCGNTNHYEAVCRSPSYQECDVNSGRTNNEVTINDNACKHNVKQEIEDPNDLEDCDKYIYSEECERPHLVLVPDFMEEEEGAAQEALSDPLAKENADGLYEEKNPLFCIECIKPKCEDQETRKKPDESVDIKHEVEDTDEQPVELIECSHKDKETEEQPTELIECKLEDKEIDEQPTELMECSHKDKETEEQQAERMIVSCGDEERGQLCIDLSSQDEESENPPADDATAQGASRSGAVRKKAPKGPKGPKGPLFSKKPFRCKVCRKAYKIDSALKTHVVRSHPNHAEYISEFKKEPWSAVVQLLAAPGKGVVTRKKGQAEASGDRLLCNHCGKPFKTAQELVAHHKKQRTKVPCDVCGCILANRFYLMRHMFLVHGGEPGDE